MHVSIAVGMAERKGGGGGGGGDQAAPVAADPVAAVAAAAASAVASRRRWLVAGEGSEYVAGVLASSLDPTRAISQIQQRTGFSDPCAAPLLALLEHLGLSLPRAAAGALALARSALLRRVQQHDDEHGEAGKDDSKDGVQDGLSKDKDKLQLSHKQLLALLTASFPYVSIPELRAVPLAVLERLRPVPPEFLKQLSADKELFRELPRSVHQQVWEQDVVLFQSHALPLLRAAWSAPALAAEQLRSLGELPLSAPPKDVRKDAVDAEDDGDEDDNECTLPAAHANTHFRKTWRAQNRELQQLVQMVGKSWRLYGSLLSLLRKHYCDVGFGGGSVANVAVCSIRSQLLMALHDSGEAGAADICARDPCHKLAWCLDACLRDGRVKEGQLRELTSSFNSLPLPLVSTSTSTPAPSRGRHQKRGAVANVVDIDAATGVSSEDEGGAGNSSSDATAVALGDAGMVLRDPPALHLILLETMRTLQALGSEAESVIRSDNTLRFYSQLILLANGARKMLRDNIFYMPVPDKSLLSSFFPKVARLLKSITETATNTSSNVNDDSDVSIGTDIDALMPFAQSDVVARKVALTLALVLLDRKAFHAVQRLLGGLSPVLEGAILEEEAVSCSALAQRLENLLTLSSSLSSAQTQELVQGPLWKSLVDGLLARASGSSPTLHDQVLKLVKAAESHLPPARLADTLDACATALIAHVSGRRGGGRRRHHHKRRRGEVDTDTEAGEVDSGHDTTTETNVHASSDADTHLHWHAHARASEAYRQLAAKLPAEVLQNALALQSLISTKSPAAETPETPSPISHPP